MRLVPASQGSAQTGAGSADGEAVKDAVNVFVRDAVADMLTGIWPNTLLLRRAGIMPPTRRESALQRQPPSVCFSQHVHGGSFCQATPPQRGP